MNSKSYGYNIPFGPTPEGNSKGSGAGLTPAPLRRETRPRVKRGWEVIPEGARAGLDSLSQALKDTNFRK